MTRGAIMALSAICGLMFGSFANVVIWRVPRKESVVRPPSHCPVCDVQLKWYENLPVIAWLIQGGKCRHCSARISARYPAVELLVAGLFLLTAWRVPRETDLIAYLPLVWVLVVLSFIDLEHKLLPNRIVFPALGTEVVLFGVAAILGPGAGAWTRALEAGAAGFAFFFVLALIAPAGMGMGDVKLSALLGLSLGYLDHGWYRLFLGFMAAFLVGALAGIGLMIAGKAGRKTQVPFGPYLALGTLIGIFWGGRLAVTLLHAA